MFPQCWHCQYACPGIFSIRLPHSRQNRLSGGPDGGAAAEGPYGGGYMGCGIAGAWITICGTWPGANPPHAVATNLPSRVSRNPCAYPSAMDWEIRTSASAGVFPTFAATSWTVVSRTLRRIAPTVWRTLSWALARQDRYMRRISGARNPPLHTPKKIALAVPRSGVIAEAI